MDVAEHEVSLFHVVDAGDLEATVLRQAENRARDATIPRFVPSKGLGFGTASLGNFCSTTDALVLRMVGDSARQEGRELASLALAARDKVQMKEQILKALLRQRQGEEDGNTNDGLGIAGDVLVATTAHAGGGAGVDASVDAASRCDGELQRREELIKSGAITPLDDITDAPTSRSRMTLMDHKIAEGMTVKLPRSRRRRNRSGISQRGLAPDGPGSEAVVSTESETVGSAESEAVVSTENATVQCPICTQKVRVDPPCNPDVILSKHMDRCSRRSGRTRRDKQNRDSRQAETNDKPRAGLRRSAASTDTDVHTTMPPPNGSTRSNSTPSVKRRRVRSRGTTRLDEANVDDVDGSLKVMAGAQLLVDDFEDEDFEARKAQAEDAVLDNLVGEELASAADILDLGDGLTMESGVAQRLFQFQLTGVRWMWQLHRQGAGGIVGDEMGLGKTVQVAAFLGALHRSNVMRRALVLCPATVLSHWMSELHAWAPQLRVVILHRCVQAFNAVGSNSGKLRALVRRVLSWPDIVVVTSYEGLKTLKALLLPCNWDYGILDEGQRIRNPDAAVTLICKQIRTVHRLVLTGTPIQNNLRELWSLFDFVFPGRLGTLPAFEAEFANPIRVGGYANASPMQARLAYRCALVLRDLIHPYLLRRQKKDLADIISLPAKTEQVLFCRLTTYQRRLYEEFLESAEVKSVLSRTMRAFRAIGILRKLCNHPDLVCRVGDSVVTRISSQRLWGESGDASESEDDFANQTMDEEEGAVQRSGKLLVLQQILPLWHKQGHRVLIFSQTRQMLNFIELFVKNMGWSYGRLDGSTPVGTRQNLIDRFNSDESIFVMLLTTRTGGVGVNLTGADRVILFDPDWNPSTDMQARERSWRVGQLRQVTVYRLVTAGTIEEKIYHRQIFKTALTNRILQDPKQRRIFSAHELGDLFTLGADGSMDGFTDTVDLFQGEGKINAPNGDRTAPSRGDVGGSSGRRGKRARKKAGESGRTKKVARAAESSTNPSPLLGTATVTLEPESGQDAGSDKTEGTQDGAASTGDDSAVLQALYDAAPLSSVFHHDLAEGVAGSGVSSVEQKRMEELAKRAAQRAVNQLRLSRHTLRAGAGQGGFQSSWTGRNGGVGSDAFSNAMPGDGARSGSTTTAPRRFGTVSNTSIAHENGEFPRQEAASLGQEGSSVNREGRGVEDARGGGTGVTSQEILRQIRQRNRGQAAPSANLFPEFGETGASEDDGKDDLYSALLQRLQGYLAQAPSGVDTAALIHAFGDVPPGDVPVFRQLLRAVAVCSNGEWTLRDARSD